mmetsp:Transcript_28464/g.59674  ORF Transcript_28464/g.59674 Transcript_28464/m.59674 type:complete len:116 (+) Transcript_28464:1-348(+)
MVLVDLVVAILAQAAHSAAPIASSSDRSKPDPGPAMAKSKNHTGHNQIYKNHRNGIKKTRRPRKMSMRGMNCRFVRNQAFAKRGMKCTPEEKEERLNAQKEAQKRFDEQKKKEAA